MNEVYYLSSLESARFEPVRECTIVRRLPFASGKECALVQLSPGVQGVEFGLVDDLDCFIITNRHEGEGLSPIEVFPCFVFVCRILMSDVKGAATIAKDDVEIIGWAELYRSREDALNHVFK